MLLPLLASFSFLILTINGSGSTWDDWISLPQRTYFGEYAHLFTEEQLQFIRSRPVRREISELSSKEWQRIVDAMWVMKTTSQSDGEKKYGKYFMNYDELVCQHLSTQTGAGDIAHHVSSFVTYHRAIEKEFELSLQAIDPLIETCPFWDYRISGHSADDSYIWTDDYFGDMVGDSQSNYAVTNGKFAYWPIADNSNHSICDSFVSQSPYGYLRSEYNVATEPYAVRYGPTFCDTTANYSEAVEYWHICLDGNYSTNITTFMGCLDKTVHGAAHTVIGGTGLMYPNQKEDMSCHTWFDWCKEHTDCIECPDCEMGVDAPVDCQCQQLDSNECSAYDTSLSMYNRSLQQNYGDFKDLGASPNDPIFVFHHINIDRYILIWQMMNRDMAEDYYLFPQHINAYGKNLDDIVGYVYPFSNLWDDSGQSYTSRDVLDFTDFTVNDYTYQDIIDMVTPCGLLKDDCNRGCPQITDESQQSLFFYSASSAYGSYSRFALWILIISVSAFVVALVLHYRSNDYNAFNPPTAKLYFKIGG